MKTKSWSLAWMAFVILTFDQAIVSSAESDNPLCDRINSGRIDLLNLQSFTYLNGTQDKVYLMEDKQFYELSFDKNDKNDIKPLGQDYWDESAMLAEILKGSGESKDTIVLVTVILLWKYESQNTYIGVVRTTEKIYVIQFKQIIATGKIEFERKNDFPLKNECPFFTLIPQHPDPDLRGYVLQDDQFQNTGSSVLYKFEFDYPKPKLAKIGDIGGLSLFYLVANKDSQDKVTLMRSNDPQAVTAVKDTPLLHNTSVGFVAPDGTLYLIEPVIGCVYIVKKFSTSSTEMSLTRKPIEKFFKCNSPNDTNSFLRQQYHIDRCDSVANVQKFFANPPTPPPPPSPPAPSPGNGVDGKNTTRGNDQTKTDSSGAAAAGSAVIPIVVGVIALVLVGVIVAYFFCCNKSSSKKQQSEQLGKTGKGLIKNSKDDEKKKTSKNVSMLANKMGKSLNGLKGDTDKAASPATTNTTKKTLASSSTANGTTGTAPLMMANSKVGGNQNTSTTSTASTASAMSNVRFAKMIAQQAAARGAATSIAPPLVVSAIGGGTPPAKRKK